MHLYSCGHVCASYTEEVAAQWTLHEVRVMLQHSPRSPELILEMLEERSKAVKF